MLKLVDPDSLFEAVIFIEPFSGVNLIALPTKLFIAWFNSVSSASIINVEGFPVNGPWFMIMSTCFSIFLGISFMFIIGGCPARFTEVVMNGFSDFWICFKK